MSVIILETIENVNGQITVYDEEGLLTIQLNQNSLKQIIDVFDNHIINKTNHSETINITEHYGLATIKIELTHEVDGFSLYSSENGSCFHDFELEFCDVDTWNKIKELI